MSVKEQLTGSNELPGDKIMILQKGALLRIEKDHEYCLIHCLSGTLWITQEGDFEDHFIVGGSEFEIGRPGITVVQALSHATIDVSHEKNDVHWSTAR